MSLENEPQIEGESQIIDPATPIICGACGAQLLGAKFCPECAAPLEPAPPACEDCGHQPEVLTIFCPECGAKMPLIG